MDTADQWPRDQVATGNDPYGSRPVGDPKKVKPQKDQAPLNCPRCNSINTKFCYYNNYSLTQPRYFCKTCRRYWTAGGSLRNVPVGGGSRKNKRSSVPNNLVTKSDISQFSFQNPNNYKPHENQDLNLAFPQEYDGVDVSRFLQVSSKIENKDNNIQLNLNSSYSSSTSTSLSAMELLKNSTAFASRGSNSYMPASIQNPNMAMYASPGFHFQGFNKPQAGFEGVHGNDGSRENVINGAADQRLLFPFGALSSKEISNTTEADQTKEDGNPTFYWNGMSSGGSW